MIRRCVLVASLWLAACGGPTGEPVEISVPAGATFSVVTDTLASHGIVRWPALFRAYARVRGDDGRVKAGRYQLAPGERWSRILDDLTAGRVVTVPLTIPEGFRLVQIAERVASLTGLSPDSVMARLEQPGADSVFGVPGPGLEGYLFPDTYRFAEGVSLDTVVAAMVRRYHRVWTPERRALRDSASLTEKDVITLASIVQAEARRPEEMPRIASVYLNRIERGMLLQADPTVLYALGGPRARLLYAAIDSVAASPYNTYTQPGLPPGPIGAPGEEAIDAVLRPSGETYLYFVAWPDGSHHFSRTLAEHNRAVVEARRERSRLKEDTGTSPR